MWAGNVHAQIKKMRELYDALTEKPEWLTAEAIDRYAAQMAAPYQVAAYHHFENGFDDKLDYQTLEEAEAAAQGYTEADILLRLSRQRHGGMAPRVITHTVKRYRMKGKLATVRKKKITGFHALYLRYLYLLRGGRRKKLPPKLPFSVKREVIHLERYEQQFKYLLSSRITTETELEQRICVLEWDIRLLEEQRKPLYQERRNTSDEEAQAKYSAEIQQQTAALREKRGELRLCRRIQSDIPWVSQQCQQAQAERQENLKNKEEHEHEYQR